eukprot:14842180-Alexandrium_andersonii.AAC.1
MIDVFCEVEERREREEEREWERVPKMRRRGLVSGLSIDEVSEEGLRAVLGFPQEISEPLDRQSLRFAFDSDGHGLRGGVQQPRETGP